MTVGTLTCFLETAVGAGPVRSSLRVGTVTVDDQVILIASRLSPPRGTLCQPIGDLTYFVGNGGGLLRNGFYLPSSAADRAPGPAKKGSDHVDREPEHKDAARQFKGVLNKTGVSPASGRGFASRSSRIRRCHE